MSLGSQKSFNEDFSEVWDHSFSFSARSVSEETISGEDGACGLAQELMAALSPAALSRLRRSFARQPRGSRADGTRKVEQAMHSAAAAEGVEFEAPPERDERHDSLCIDEAGFVAAIGEIFEHQRYSPHAHQLFQLLTPLGARLGSWGALLGRLGAACARRTRGRRDHWAPVGPGVMRRMKHCKRETIVKLVHVGTSEWFCFACVSRGGRVGLYCAGMRLLHHYQLWYHRTGMSRRVKNAWVTDAVFMSDVQCLLISASDRSLTIYDASILSHTPLYCVTGMPNIPTCLAYAPSSPGYSHSELLIGDERGAVTELRFLQPRVALLHKLYADKINTYFWMELSSPPHDAYCSWRRWRDHERSVRRVSASRAQPRASCARGRRAVALRPRGNAPVRILAVDRGVSCLQLVPSLRLLVTGSPDGAVRLWDVSQSAPFATLWGSVRAAVLDVAVLPKEAIVLAFCSNCTLEIWDLYEECLLQSIRVRFPCLGVLGRKAEFGSYCIHAGLAPILQGAPRRRVAEDSSPRELIEAEACSRRSSVYREESGGLKFMPQPEIEEDGDMDATEFNCRELIFTCCDYTYSIQLGTPLPRPHRGVDEEEGEWEALPPPGDTRRARRPSAWDIASDTAVLGPIAADSPTKGPQSPFQAPRSDLQPSVFLRACQPGQALLTPVSARVPAVSTASSIDLEELLESAGLQGILEKDVTLMQPLKHDLNAKIAELARNMDQIAGPVAAGAPYLALQLHDPVPLEPVDEMTARYKNILRLFPAASSISSTPRSQRSGSSRTLSRKTKSTRSS